MQLVEAHWLGTRLAAFPEHELFPIIDVGSSSHAYRTHEQPFIEELVFAPLVRRDGRVWHVDLKQVEGVDLTGDLLDPFFRARLAGLRARATFAFNVLQHVPDPRAFAVALTEVVPTRGLLFLSGARSLPPTRDPIDTAYRPTVVEVTELFPECDLVEGTIVDAGNWRTWRASERGNRSLARYLARLATPFYRPSQWVELAGSAPWLWRHLETWIVVLRKR